MISWLSICNFILMNETFYYNSPVGILTIKTTDEMVTEVTFAETEKRKNNIAASAGEPLNPLTKKCVDQLDEYFAGRSLSFDLPLAQEGTTFQQSVWSALLNIPYGRTVSYLHLSKTLGNVKAIRAVGTANGKNNIAIIVPCHRVIGSNGSLVGYGGDLWRKQWLLDHEAKYANGVQTLF
jgi:methylated-DNA-[protein]-cysteine S-methyltransferase